jgi:hypothetical protein
MDENEGLSRAKNARTDPGKSISDQEAVIEKKCFVTLLF